MWTALRHNGRDHLGFVALRRFVNGFPHYFNSSKAHLCTLPNGRWALKDKFDEHSAR